MRKVFRKKNHEYTTGERWYTAVIAFLLFGIITIMFSLDSTLFSELSDKKGEYLSYILGSLIALSAAIYSFKFPKFVQLFIFIMPFLILGN